jgi:hypothetical protein
MMQLFLVYAFNMFYYHTCWINHSCTCSFSRLHSSSCMTFCATATMSSSLEQSKLCFLFAFNQDFLSPQSNTRIENYSLIKILAMWFERKTFSFIRSLNIIQWRRALHVSDRTIIKLSLSLDRINVWIMQRKVIHHEHSWTSN